jgi:hypothetical protein
MGALQTNCGRIGANLESSPPPAFPSARTACGIVSNVAVRGSRSVTPIFAANGIATKAYNNDRITCQATTTPVSHRTGRRTGSNFADQYPVANIANRTNGIAKTVLTRPRTGVPVAGDTPTASIVAPAMPSTNPETGFDLSRPVARRGVFRRPCAQPRTHGAEATSAADIAPPVGSSQRRLGGCRHVFPPDPAEPALRATDPQAPGSTLRWWP